MANDIKVFLVPGFFGFSSLGSMNYFEGVEPLLTGLLNDRGLSVDVIDCATLPTGSIRYRADRLLQQVLDHGGLDAQELHFVGHSTGGLDIRLLLTPDVHLRPGDDEKRVADKTVSATSVATPHFGTPLATFFTSAQGRNLLRFLTVMATSERGRYSIFAASQLLRLVARLDDRIGRRNTILDMVAEQLVRHISLKSDDAFFQFLSEISEDQGAIVQLTPEGTNLFNAAVTDAPHVRYGSVITCATQPNLKTLSRIWTLDHAARYSVFSLMHRLAAMVHRPYPYPEPGPEFLERAEATLGVNPDERSSDGVVPTLSQLHGDILGVFSADHLDVVGQFYRADVKPYADWLPSGSGFTQERFEEVWGCASDFIARDKSLRASG